MKRFINTALFDFALPMLKSALWVAVALYAILLFGFGIAVLAWLAFWAVFIVMLVARRQDHLAQADAP